MARSSVGWLVLVGITMAAATLAQQPQQAPRPGISVPPLGDGPFVFDTGEQHKIRAGQERNPRVALICIKPAWPCPSRGRRRHPGVYRP